MMKMVLKSDILIFFFYFREVHYIASQALEKSGDTFMSHKSLFIFKVIRPSACLSKITTTWLIFSEVLMIEHLYLACMVLVTNPSGKHNAMTLTFHFLQGQIRCRMGDNNSM